MARDKDKDNDSSTINISLFKTQIKKELITKYDQEDIDYAVTPEERKSWSNLNLLELVYNNTHENPSRKEIGSG